MTGRRLPAAVWLALSLIWAASAAADPPSPYSSAPFSVATHPYTFGQAPVFTPDGRIIVGKDFRGGDGMQVYSSGLDGTGRRCLTCEMKAPNNVPAPRPQGDWILFHSWNGHRITFGSPGYGGVGPGPRGLRPRRPPQGAPPRTPPPPRGRGG